MKTTYFKLIVLAALLMIFGVLAARSLDVLDNFDITPNPMGRYTTIRIAFKCPTAVDLYLVDSHENLVKSFFNGTVDQEENIEWNRLDNAGVYVPAGTYHVVLNYGGRYTSTKKTLILR
ncbi:MAG: hypothetical protein PHI68_05025 [Candidatus Cloacimonetes bacterium]|nr:hypothetical protein [Candidatus Cloacimonadota bacterium]